MPGLDPETVRQLRALSEQQQNLAREVVQQVQPLLDALKRGIQTALAGIAKDRQLWVQALESVRIPELQLPPLRDMMPQLAEVQASIARSLEPALEAMRRAAEVLPPRTRAALLTLGRHGWYLDLNIDLQLLWELQDLLEQGDVDTADHMLCEYFEDRLDSIEASLKENSPHRAHLLGAAANAHREGQYVLSIPVVLAQTDGICMDLTSRHLFLRQNGKPETAAYVEAVAAETLRAALLSPLAEVLPIGQSKRERSEGFDALNRHTVMHGESLDYGTRLNSLKAISLLNYVSQVLKNVA